jgi:predicted MFS family arabinose efflux permease
MVDLRTLPNAVAIHASNFNVQRLIGPAIGGLMIDRFGTGTTIFVNFIILLPFLVVLFFLDVREKEESERAQQRNFLAEFWGGAKHAAVHAVIREAMILTCVTSLTVRGVLEILPAIADGEFQRGAEGLGQMVSVGGAGALLAALIIAFRQTRQWRGIPMIGHFAVFLGVFGVTGLGLAGTWTSAMLAVAVCGFCGTMIGINMQSTIQLNVEDEYRGRVMSLWIMAGIGTSALGALLLGAAADVFGLAQTLVSGGLASAIVVAAVRFTHWRAALRDDPAD